MQDHNPSGGYSDTWVRFRQTGLAYVVDETGPVSQVAGERIDYFYIGSPTGTMDVTNAGAVEGDGRWIWLATGTGSGNVNVCHIDDDGVMRMKHTFVGSEGLTDAIVTDAPSYPAVYADNGLCYIVVSNCLFCYSREGEIDGTGLPLSEVVADATVSTPFQVYVVSVKAPPFEEAMVLKEKLDYPAHSAKPRRSA